MWFYSYILFLLVSSLHGKSLSSDTEKRIIGGKNVLGNEFLYQVAVVYRAGSTDRFMCGGALISTKTIITTTACFNIDLRNLQRFEIRASSQTWKYEYVGRNVERLVRHESNLYLKKYQDGYPSNYADLNLAIVDTAFNEINFTPLKLPSPGDTIKAGDTVTMTGWGRESWEGWGPDVEYDISVGEVLKQKELTVMSENECTKRLPWAIVLSLYQQVCTVPPSEKDDSPWTTCYGDFGNPIVKNGTLVGLFSYQIELCHFYYPPVFQLIEPYVDWINRNLE